MFKIFSKDSAERHNFSPLIAVGPPPKHGNALRNGSPSFLLSTTHGGSIHTSATYTTTTSSSSNSNQFSSDTVKNRSKKGELDGNGWMVGWMDG
ncbi:unnamed protein product [Strongylus vulgaris]|uniref:Uncharacterized protein n=1 Tax=Strongylus vulgaris TaxID=40348 RepID=A0A3P7J957_STRVU|nr:unnamed protein product [Strongylus vulgaris]